MTTGAPLDWTDGQPGIVAYHCGSCSQVFYFKRAFCPRCGSTAVTARQSAGTGTVQARTMLHRPVQHLRAFAPYLIVLVRLDDGFTVMAHGDHALAIGEAVRAEYIAFGDLPVIPFFVPIGAP